MWRNQYDQDCLTWSPEGKIMQIDYAMEAVRQGSISIGLKSDEYAILMGLKRSPHIMSGYQEKIFKIDDHIGVAISGITADGRTLCKILRTECQSYKFMYNSSHPLNRLVYKIGQKSQIKTQRGGKRPFGVGLLVAGYDESGTHIYQTCPSAEYFEYYAFSIGAKSQSAKTYFEKHCDEFKIATAEQLIMHGLAALKASENDIELTEKNVTLAIVGKGTEFKQFKESEIAPYLQKLKQQAPVAGERMVA